MLGAIWIASKAIWIILWSVLNHGKPWPQSLCTFSHPLSWTFPPSHCIGICSSSISDTCSTKDLLSNPKLSIFWITEPLQIHWDHWAWAPLFIKNQLWTLKKIINVENRIMSLWTYRLSSEPVLLHLTSTHSPLYYFEANYRYHIILCLSISDCIYKQQELFKDTTTTPQLKSL